MGAENKDIDVKEEKGYKYFWPIIIFSILLVFSLWFWNYYYLIDREESDRGTFGDMFGVVNAVFSGNIDASGKISISENLEEKSYYVDIYTEDKVLSNWQVTDLDVDTSNIIKFYTANTNEFYAEVYMKDNRRLVGNWSFLSYEHINNDNEERTDKVFLSINKEFTATSYETYEGIAYQLHFKLLGNGYLELVTIQPSPDNYPVSQTSTQDLVVQIEQDGLLYFTNYSGNKAVYVSN